jgi:hypothetical protein
MPMHSMDELFHNLLQDVYYAEKQLLKTLPKLAKRSTNEKLQEAFATHRDETEGHIERLEKVFEMIGKKPHAKTCDAILGIIAEGQEVMEEAKDDSVRDAGILAAWPPRKRPNITKSPAMERCGPGPRCSVRTKLSTFLRRRCKRKSTPTRCSPRLHRGASTRAQPSVRAPRNSGAIHARSPRQGDRAYLGGACWI